MARSFVIKIHVTLNRVPVIVLLSMATFILLDTGCTGPPVKPGEPDETIVYPPPPAMPRIQYLTSFSSSEEFCDPQSRFNRFVFGEEDPMPIIKPYGITIHGTKIYICDTGLGGLEVLDLGDHSFAYFKPGGLGQLQFPLNCAVDDMGYLYVADGNRKQVVVFDANLQYVDAITLENSAKPTDVEVNDSLLLVAAMDDHSIHVYDKSSLEFRRRIPEAGIPAPIRLYQPANLVLIDSLLMVSDIGGCRVALFSQGGTALSSFGKPGRGFGDFTRPKGIAADRQGNIYVVDAAFENIQIFNPEGDLLMNFGGTYSGPGGMWLPAAVAIDYENLEHFRDYVNERYHLEYLVFVTNQYGPDRVSVYGYIGPTE